jgi:hypothetical protein
MGKKGERGQAIMLALIVMAVGSLVTTPFLGAALTGVNSTEVFEDRLLQQYAADAGVEWGIWHVRSESTTVPPGGQVTLPTFTLNGLDVTVTLQDLGSDIYEVSARAGDGGGATSILADAAVGALPFGFTLVSGDTNYNGQTITVDDLYVEGEVQVTGGTEIGGNLYAEGDIHFGGGANVVSGNVITNGNLTIAGGSQIIGGVCVTGDLTMSSSASIGGDAHVLGSVTLSGQASIGGDVYVGGSVAINGGAEILGSYPLAYVSCPAFEFPETEDEVYTWEFSYQ